MFLQSYVAPVCLCEVDPNGGANIRELFGTAFLINDKGVFLTARHVLEDAYAKAQENGQIVGLIVKGEAGSSPKSGVAPIKSFEHAPAPYDVSIGTVHYQSPTLLRLAPIEIEPWQDVAAYGYPIHAVSGPASALGLNLRCHKGYIQRLLSPGDIPLGSHPDGFELSFLVARGISGAPLFVHRQDKDIVIGVCVGSFRTEQIEDEFVEISQNGSTYKEIKIKIDEFSTAQDIRPLHGWKPELLAGATLLEASA